MKCPKHPEFRAETCYYCKGVEMRHPLTKAINAINQVAYKNGFRTVQILMPSYLRESLIKEAGHYRTTISANSFDCYGDEFGVIHIGKSKNLTFKFTKESK